jgi:hypothetical protein
MRHLTLALLFVFVGLATMPAEAVVKCACGVRAHAGAAE